MSLTDDIDATGLDDEPGRTLPGRRTRITWPDGRTEVVRITNRELVLWDKTAPRHKWGSVQDVPFLAQSFTTYAAARRDGSFTGTFDAWNEMELALEDLAEDESDVARPTRKALGATS